jgi:hypothetical protein
VSEHGRLIGFAPAVGGEQGRMSCRWWRSLTWPRRDVDPSGIHRLLCSEELFTSAALLACMLGRRAGGRWQVAGSRWRYPEELASEVRVAI